MWENIMKLCSFPRTTAAGLGAKWSGFSESTRNTAACQPACKSALRQRNTAFHAVRGTGT